jgi:pimeloyl-ACP methyl ester carboxylesterase
MTDCCEQGEGPPLMLLHGLGGSWHIWKPVIPLLEVRYRIYAPTLPGHLGGTGWPRDRAVNVDNLVGLVIEDLARKGWDRPHIAGNSLGGWIALELLRQQAARSVTALSPAGSWQTADQYASVARSFRIVYALMPLIRGVASPFLRSPAFRRAINAQAMEHGDRMAPADVATALNALSGAKILPALLSAMRHDGSIKPLSAEDVPVTIAWAENDQVIPFETFGTTMVSRITGARVTTLKGCGHVPMYDDPDQVAATVMETAKPRA